MANIKLNQQDWDIRLFVYEVMVTTGQAPTYHETAQRFGISSEEARLAYHRLHEAHALFLHPSSDDIMMAQLMP